MSVQILELRRVILSNSIPETFLACVSLLFRFFATSTIIVLQKIGVKLIPTRIKLQTMDLKRIHDYPGISRGELLYRKYKSSAVRNF